MEGFMSHASEMGSGATIYTPVFTKTVSPIQKLIVGVHIQTDTDTDTHGAR
jgi:hypothetical protein